MSDILILDTLTPKQLEGIEQQITTSLAQKQGFIPVSYTHLDVYKRQAHR